MVLFFTKIRSDAFFGGKYMIYMFFLQKLNKHTPTVYSTSLNLITYMSAGGEGNVVLPDKYIII